MAVKSKRAKRAGKRPAARKVSAKRTAKKRVPAKRASKVAKKSLRGSTAGRSAARKTTKATPKSRRSSRRSKDVIGEGNYTASREFRKDQTDFVQRNKSRISKLGKQAERALDGPEGDELRQAEEEGRSHAHE
ncbi:MAG TPA: hypothetical protein VGM36_01165 [Rhizomicrobium sp.]|jgi:hypothetical protein